MNELVAYLAEGNEMPRHNKTQDSDERGLGVWLHTQRIDYRSGKLTSAKESELNTVIPGWRQGRPRRGANSGRSAAPRPARNGEASGRLPVRPTFEMAS